MQECQEYVTQVQCVAESCQRTAEHTPPKRRVLDAIANSGMQLADLFHLRFLIIARCSLCETARTIHSRFTHALRIVSLSPEP